MAESLLSNVAHSDEVIKLSDKSPHSIHTLPPEIFLSILSFIQTSEHDYWRWLRNQYSFMRVCRGWNEFIISQPQLWSEVQFTADYTFSGVAHPVTRLERSKSCLLHISISNATDQVLWEVPKDRFRTIESGLYDVLSLHFHRAHTIKLDLTSLNWAETLLPLPKNLAALKVLTLWANSSVTLPNTPLFAADCVSRLEILNVDAKAGIGSLVFDHLDASCVKEVRIRAPALLSLESLRFVSCAPSIKHLDLFGNTSTFRSMEAWDIHTPALESITIGGDMLRSVSLWDAPKLSELNIFNTLRHWPKRLMKFPSLVTLNMSSMNATSKEIEEVLASLPSIENIGVGVDNDADEVNDFATLVFTVLASSTEPLSSTFNHPATPPDAPSLIKYPCPLLRCMYFCYEGTTSDFLGVERCIEDFIHTREQVRVELQLAVYNRGVDGEDDDDEYNCDLAERFPDRVAMVEGY